MWAAQCSSLHDLPPHVQAQDQTGSGGGQGQGTGSRYSPGHSVNMASIGDGKEIYRISDGRLKSSLTTVK